VHVVEVHIIHNPDGGQVNAEVEVPSQRIENVANGKNIHQGLFGFLGSLGCSLAGPFHSLGSLFLSFLRIRGLEFELCQLKHFQQISNRTFRRR